MKKTLLNLFAAACLALGTSSAALAASAGIAWDKAPVNVNDHASLQNGAKLFVNYCLNCHSAASMRYNRMVDIGLTEAQIKDNLMVTGEKVGETMQATINPLQAKAMFGAAPPDLSVIARSRAGAGGTGADYLYTYLRSYYRDETTTTGWNNFAFPLVAMPHVLWELQGERKPIYETVQEEGHTVKKFTGKWEQISAGTMTPAKFDQSVGDLVNFLQWMGEPGQAKRTRLGWYVLAFLAMLSFFTWRLSKAYWKDVK